MSALSDEAKKNIDQHIKENWLDKRKCSVCEANQWVYPDAVYELREFNYGGLGSGPIIPLVPVTCQICGYILLFNAIHVQALKIGAREHFLGRSTVNPQ